MQSKGKSLRIFFVFDPVRQAILLCASGKAGEKRMISLAEQECKQHVEQLEQDNSKNT